VTRTALQRWAVRGCKGEAECGRDSICKMSLSLQLSCRPLSVAAGECRREYMGKAGFDTRSWFATVSRETLVNCCRRRGNLRRMQEELHDIVGPGSTPGRGSRAAVV
jgi:hypothetical protein